MFAADNLISGSHNACGKPTLALTILQGSLLGREQFDFAFKQYANRWKFKRPTPFDFFRTMAMSPVEGNSRKRPESDHGCRKRVLR